MSWNLFLKSLEDLNSNLTTPSNEKKEVYKILVAHNKNAELDFLMRLTKRKLIKKFQELNPPTKSTHFTEYEPILNTAPKPVSLVISSQYRKEHTKVNNFLQGKYKYHTFETGNNVTFNASILQRSPISAVAALGSTSIAASAVVVSSTVAISGAILNIALSLGRKKKIKKVAVPAQTDTATSFFFNFSI